MKIENREPEAARVPETSPPSPVRPPRRPLTAWVLVLPIALLLGVIYESGRDVNNPLTPSTPDRVVARKRHPLRPKTTPEAATTQATQRESNAKGKQTYTLYVPGTDTMLHPQTVAMTEGSGDNDYAPGQYEAWYNKHASRALELLFKQTNIFPTGTKVPPVSLKDDVVTVSFNKNFQTSKLWQSEKITQLAIYSIVNTLTSKELNRDDKPKKVLLLIEDKPVQTLGEFDTSDPIEPNMTLVAQS